MNLIQKIPIPNEQALWFVEKQINVFEILEFFPTDAIGTHEKEGTSITLETDLGWNIETDIEIGKFCFRKKSKSMNGTGKWVIESHLSVGDKICIEKISEYRYKIFIEKSSVL